MVTESITPGKNDGKPAINGLRSPEPRNGEKDAIVLAIRGKLSQLDPFEKRLGKDNRSFSANLQIDTAIHTGALSSFGGNIPPDPLPEAIVRLSHDLTKSVVAVEVKPSAIDMPSAVWELTADNSGRERWTFKQGHQVRKLRPGPSSVANMKAIIDHAHDPERTTDYYQRFVDRWADIAKWSQEDRVMVQTTLRLADESHKGVLRESKEPYIAHAFQTAKQLFDWGVRDPHVIGAALVHDVPEDSMDFKPHKGETDAHWFNRALRMMRTKTKDHQIAWLSVMMSRLREGITTEETVEVEGKFLLHKRMFTREERDNRYAAQILSDQRIIEIKLSDRLHNLWTLWAMPVEKRLRTLAETKETYFKLIDRLGQENPHLASKIRRAYVRAISENEALLAEQAS